MDSWGARTVPFTEGNLRALFTPVTSDRADCEICREIPRVTSVLEKHGETDGEHPAAVGRLVVFLRIPESNHQEVRRCPLCGHFYLYRYEYEYLTTGSEDETTYEWTTPDRVLALYAVKRPQRSELRFDGTAWTLVDLDAEARREAQKKRRTARRP